MKYFKKFVLAGLGLAVLGFLTWTFYSSKNPKARFLASLVDKLPENCEQGLDELFSKQRGQYLCDIEIPEKGQKGASYTLNTLVKIKRLKTGNYYLIVSGTMSDGTKHALHSKFCDTCKKTKNLPADTGKSLIKKEIYQLVQVTRDRAKEDLAKAYGGYVEKGKARALIKFKEDSCLGRWDEVLKTFQAFDSVDELHCEMKKFTRMPRGFERNNYYKTVFKLKLWNQVLEEDELYETKDLLAKLEKTSQDLAPSSKLSIRLIKEFVGWKDVYPYLDSEREVDHFVKNLVHRSVNWTARMGKEGEYDLMQVQKGVNTYFGYPNLNLKEVSPTDPLPKPKTQPDLR